MSYYPFVLFHSHPEYKKTRGYNVQHSMSHTDDGVFLSNGFVPLKTYWRFWILVASSVRFLFWWVEMCCVGMTHPGAASKKGFSC